MSFKEDGSYECSTCNQEGYIPVTDETYVIDCPECHFNFFDMNGMQCVGYDEQIDIDFLNVLMLIKEKISYYEIAKRLELPEQYIELIQSIFCSAGWCEYGTSPRACWIAHDYKLEYPPFDLIEKFKVHMLRWERNREL